MVYLNRIQQFEIFAVEEADNRQWHYRLRPFLTTKENGRKLKSNLEWALAKCNILHATANNFEILQ